MFELVPDSNLGNRPWEACEAPVGESDVDKKAFWRCCSCGFVVGFWLEGYGSTPISSKEQPPDNVGIYTGTSCNT